MKGHIKMTSSRQKHTNRCLLWLPLLMLFLLFGCRMSADAAVSTTVKTLSAGSSYTINNYPVVKSGNNAVATVKKMKANSYKVTGHRKGKTSLSLCNNSGRVLKKVYLLVTDSTSFQYDTSSVTMVKGASKTVTAKAQNGCKVSYSSSNGNIASVTSSGKITAQRRGTATISAKFYYRNKLVKTLQKKVTVKINKGQSKSSNTVRILFVGNSRTYVHDIPTKFTKLAKSLGKDVSVSSVTYPNATLQWLSKNRKSQITSKSYDYVILQEVSEQCINYNTFYNGASAVAKMVRQKNPNVQIILRKMWKRRSDGTRLRDLAYKNSNKVAKNIGATMSFDGPAFERCSSLYPSLKPMEDNSHQSTVGAYLSACCVYTAVFKESPVGSTYYSTLGKSTAQKLQQVALDVS